MKQYLDLLRKIMDEGVTVRTGATLTSEGRQPTARRLHGEQLVFDLNDGFPAVTTKPLFWRGVVAEWIWFMRGDPNVSWLRDEQNVHIWDQWADEDGYLGPVYGQQFRRYQGVKWAKRAISQPDVPWDTLHDAGRAVHATKYASDTLDLVVYQGYLYGLSPRRSGRLVSPAGMLVHKLGPYHEIVEIDQIGQARDDIRAVIANPFNRARRRIIVTLWNPAQVPVMSLPPCHTFHFYDMVPPYAGKGIPVGDGCELTTPPLVPHDTRWTLNLHLCARSIDAVKGLPFNIASYALMLSVMAQITNCRPGKLLITFNDVHVYDNQFKDVEEQLRREPYAHPKLHIGVDAEKHGDARFADVCKDLSIEEAHRLEPSMFQLVGYKHHPRLKSESEVAV